MNWKYCECGCHGHEVSIGKMYFWLYNDLKGNFYLHNGHGKLSPLVSKLSSFNGATEKVKQLVSAELKNLTKALKEL